MHLRRRPERDERGAVAILVAVSLVALCMATAMAVDIGNVAQLHRHAQLTVDDAAISGADLLETGTDSLTQIVSASETYIDENWSNLDASAWATCPSIPTGFSAPLGLSENCITFNGTSTANATAISVEFPPQSVPFTVARLGGFTSGTVEAKAEAVTVPGTAPCALCILGTSGLTLNDTGNGTFKVTDSAGSGTAGIIVNSPGTPAAQINGSGTISAPAIDINGTYAQKNSSSFIPNPVTGFPAQPDPLGNLAAPTALPDVIPSSTYSSTSANPVPLLPGWYGSISIGGNGTVTIPPGNYSNISVIGGATLTLESGNYFISGAFTVGGTGGASVIQNGGVFLYFTCSSGGDIAACASGGAAGGSLSLSGTGQMQLDPQTTGPYANLTVFYDRNNDSPLNLSGTPDLSITGTIYAKDSALSLNGTGDTISSLIIVNSATISGNGTIGVNYDAADNASTPGAPYLCSTDANNC